MARIGWTAVAVLAGALTLAAAASAVSPDVAAMNLQAADVPGAKVVNQHAVKEPGYVAAHFRSFVFSTPNSFGSWPTRMVSASPMMKPLSTGSEMSAARKPRRIRPAASAINPTVMASAAVSAA